MAGATGPGRGGPLGRESGAGNPGPQKEKRFVERTILFLLCVSLVGNRSQRRERIQWCYELANLFLSWAQSPFVTAPVVDSKSTVTLQATISLGVSRPRVLHGGLRRAFNLFIPGSRMKRWPDVDTRCRLWS